MIGRFVPAREPKEFPETVLWTLAKAHQRLEARVRFLPFGDYRPELRIYFSDRADVFDLLQSVVLQPGEDLRDGAQREQRQFEVEGWSKVRDVSPADTAGVQLTTIPSCSRCLDGWICEVHPDQP